MPNNRFRDACCALFAACTLALGLVLQGCGNDNGSQGPSTEDAPSGCGCANNAPPGFPWTEASADAPGEASETAGPEAGDAGGGTNDAADAAVDAGADAATDAAASASAGDAADAAAE